MDISVDLFDAPLGLLCGIKDVNHQFTHLTNEMSKLVGYASNREITDNGLTDYDAKSKSAEYASHFIQEDIEIMETGKPITYLGNFCYIDDYWHTHIYHKTPYRTPQGEIKGVLFNIIELKGNPLKDFCLKLLTTDRKFNLHHGMQGSYKLDQAYKNANLSERQTECLFYIMRGKTPKEIAMVLEISIRTVYDHIERIKAELNCQTRSQIIDFCIEKGYLYTLPKGILSKTK